MWRLLIFKVRLDSGASIYSRREVLVSLKDVGVSDKEWTEFSDEEKDSFIHDIAFERADWGWAEE